MDNLSRFWISRAFLISDAWRMIFVKMVHKFDKVLRRIKYLKIQ